jgi:hypothetical protein
MTPTTRIRVFIGRPGKYAIDHGAIVRVLRFYPRRRALIEYAGRKHLTFSTLLRRPTP